MMIQIRRTDFLQGSTRLDLVDDAGRSLSHLDGIVPLTLHFGKDQAFVVDLPQVTLARPVFGAMDAADILDYDGIRADMPALAAAPRGYIIEPAAVYQMLTFARRGGSP